MSNGEDGRRQRPDLFESGWGCFLVFFAFIGVLFGVGGLCVYFQPPETREPIKSNIERVFMHEVGQYSVLIDDGGRLRSRQLGWAEVFIDVEAGTPMYYEAVHCVKKNHHDHLEDVKIHIHSAADIGGAGWTKRVGKNGHIEGQTTVIE